MSIIISSLSIYRSEAEMKLCCELSHNFYPNLVLQVANSAKWNQDEAVPTAWDENISHVQ